MELRLGNILAGFLLIGCIWIFAKSGAEVAEVLDSIFKVGPGNPPAIQMQGCIAIGLIILGLVSALKLILAERRK